MLGILQWWADIYNPYRRKLTTDEHYKGRKIEGALQRKVATVQGIDEENSKTTFSYICVLPPLNSPLYCSVQFSRCYSLRSKL
jgi:hypothetical protein